MAGEKERVEAYLDTLSRASAFYALAAISLKRIADAAEIANRLMIATENYKSQRDKEQHHEWLRRHGLGDLVPKEV